MQPVPQFEEDPDIDVNEPIDPIKTVAEIRAVTALLSSIVQHIILLCDT